MMNEVLQRVGLKYEDLTSAERDTLSQWSNAVQEKQLTVSQVKDHIRSMRGAVERELTEENIDPATWLNILTLIIPLYGLIKKWYQDKRTYSLQARLKNYMLLEAFLDTPEKTRQALDQAVAGLVSNTKRR